MIDSTPSARASPPAGAAGRRGHRQHQIHWYNVKRPAGAVTLPGRLMLPPAPRGFVMVAHGSRANRRSPRDPAGGQRAERRPLRHAAVRTVDARRGGPRRRARSRGAGRSPAVATTLTATAQRWTSCRRAARRSATGTTPAGRLAWDLGWTASCGGSRRPPCLPAEAGDPVDRLRPLLEPRLAADLLGRLSGAHPRVVGVWVLRLERAGRCRARG